MDSAWFRKLFGVLLVSAVVAVCAAGCGGDDTTIGTCDYDDKHHMLGDMFPAGDGCNTCTCTNDGVVICSTRPCDATCEFDGQRYAAGDRFMLDDRCDECTCKEDGTIDCGESDDEDCLRCNYQGVSYAAGDSFKAADGCNECTCDARGEVACTERACGTCAYAGQFYAPGQGFRAVDGCNDCMCSTNLTVSCTDRACALCESGGQRFAIGEEFVGEDGCSRCSCDRAGIISCEYSECPEGCRLGARWFEPGETVVCPEGCGTCECTDALEWQKEPVMCQVRFADLCVGGPGDNRIEGALIYVQGDSLAVEADERMCPASYVLCFNEAEGAGTFASPVVDVWLVPREEQSCEEQVGQFAFNLVTIRDYFWSRSGPQSARVTLRMSGDTATYSY